MTTDAEIIFEHRGAIGLVTLNRPKALNALTHDMCLKLKSQLDLWRADSNIGAVVIQGAGDRAFCAGGDIRTLYESGKSGTSYAIDFYRDEYLLNAEIKHFPKPYIALIRGFVMGGGVGVSVHGSHSIADETTLFAMPETGIGLFPDVGGSWFLPRMPGELGLYLGLTGARLKTPDAIYAGVATHFVPGAKHPALIDRLAEGGEVDIVLRDFAETLPDTYLLAHRAKIDAVFSASSAEEILAALDSDHTDFAGDTAKVIRTKSPTATKLAYRQIREGRSLDFDGCMRMEYRMVHRVIAGHDFYEGVRATIIDKDGAPHWKPDALSQVSAAAIDAYFAPLGEKELPL